MNFEIVNKHFVRPLVIISSLAIAVAFAESIGDFFGFSLVGDSFSPGRLLELAAVLLVFVVVILLRQIRDELRKTQGS
jgi:hypothetical protein